MEVGIIILLELIALNHVLLDPILVSDWLFRVRVQLAVDCEELLLELLNLIEILLLLLVFLTLLFFFFGSSLLCLFLVHRLLDLLCFVLIGYEGWRRELASDLAAIPAERL